MNEWMMMHADTGALPKDRYHMGDQIRKTRFIRNKEGG